MNTKGRYRLSLRTEICKDAGRVYLSVQSIESIDVDVKPLWISNWRNIFDESPSRLSNFPIQLLQSAEKLKIKILMDDWTDNYEEEAFSKLENVNHL